MAAMTELPWQPIYDELGVGVPPLDDRPLGHFVEEHAANRPDAVALQYLDREISYRELNELANRCANGLLALDVARGDVVGIHLPNVPQYVIALVACCKIGCAGSGVSPLLTPAEVAYQIADAGIGVLLSLDGLAASVIARIEEQPACLRHVIVTGAADHIAPSRG
ncbi:MAG: AMP-binding protein, partial [Halioglobus sp.]|nr:AMP-binding protein [Halioglobus sp.]